MKEIRRQMPVKTFGGRFRVPRRCLWLTCYFFFEDFFAAFFAAFFLVAIVVFSLLNHDA